MSVEIINKKPFEFKPSILSLTAPAYYRKDLITDVGEVNKELLNITDEELAADEGKAKSAKLKTFEISNQLKDRHQNIIYQDGWYLKNFHVNPVVTLNHKDSSENLDMILGKARAFKSEAKLFGRIKFDVDGEGATENREAKKAVYKIENGFLNMTSIRLLPIEWRMGEKEKGEDENIFYFVKQDLLAFSLVTVPANPFTKEKSEMENFLEAVWEATEFINKNKDVKVEVFEETKDEALNPDIEEAKQISSIKSLLAISRSRLKLRMS